MSWPSETEVTHRQFPDRRQDSNGVETRSDLISRIISEGNRTDNALTPMPETSGLGEIPVQILGIQNTLNGKGY